MVNKPKQIGTFGETAVLKQVLPYFPTAERLVLHGDKDQGDIAHCGDFIFEVKAGRQTDQIGDGKLAKWMSEALAEAQHRRVPYGVLVTQRRGFGAPNARRWWAHVRMEDFAEVCGGYYAPGRFAVVRLELGDFLDLLADQGYTPNVADTPAEIVLDVPAFAITSPSPEEPIYVESVDVPDTVSDPSALGAQTLAAEYAAIGITDEEISGTA